MKHRLQSYIVLSIAAAVITLVLKLTAYLLTNSVGLVSEAVESVVNLVAAVTAFFTLRWAAVPADRDHTYGHEKIEFFSSGIEGLLIAAAGLGIIGYAAYRLLTPAIDRAGSRRQTSTHGRAYDRRRTDRLRLGMVDEPTGARRGYGDRGGTFHLVDGIRPVTTLV
jgi:divalent metal cation (Fe/Co/Zn/Cd) transporter